MITTKMQGFYREKNKIFTENLCKGCKVYNERLIKIKGKEYRSWNPYRSKLAAAILNGLSININSNSNFLYLGAATGTTVSHISDILNEGLVYSVESSPIAVKKFIQVCEKRKNIIPILEDANHPDRYSSIVPIVDFVYQDISQRNQAEIFIENIERYLKKDGFGIIMVKARSIDVSLEPKKAFDIICSKLEENGLKILKRINLKPYEKDHSAIMISI
ncbi:MAG: fibrillarin-like rRNA/tRNA 2'-O-methyltransferase [Thermoplasmatales archaeon]|nr:MAG: fibrillarin-like rRNA/tRNA 2'-O-methyltransferase [Thermoplasmatales archaeon]